MNWLSKIEDAGVIGAGGAGFPTHVKPNTHQQSLIINGIECEPLLVTDKYLMRTYAKEMIETVEFLKSELGASRAVIGIKDKNTNEIKTLQRAIDEMESSVEIVKIQNYYPAGDEHILVKEVTGRSIPPGGIPLDVGAVVINVATLLDTSHAMKDKPVTHRVVTVTGAVRNPVLVKVPIGTSLAECIEVAGGTQLKTYKVLIGGPIMGGICEQEDTEITSITKTTNGLIVVESDCYLVTMKQLPMDFIIRRTESACIQCQMCTDLCPRFLNGHPLYPHQVMRAIGTHSPDVSILKSALLCCECGVCELYACPMGLSPKTVNQHVKKVLGSQGIRINKAEYTRCEAHEMMPFRKIHTTRIMARVDLLKYEGIHIEALIEHKPKQVTIPLKQHLGQAAKPIIVTGTLVVEGMCIAKMESSVLGAAVHASISGRATVMDWAIRIDSEEVQYG